MGSSQNLPERARVFKRCWMAQPLIASGYLRSHSVVDGMVCGVVYSVRWLASGDYRGGSTQIRTGDVRSPAFGLQGIHGGGHLPDRARQPARDQNREQCDAVIVLRSNAAS
jgi:hypothetical protein